MKNPLIIAINQVQQSDIELVGGKAANLGDLARGLKVPPGFCITSDAYSLHLAQDKTQDKIMDLLEQASLQDLKIIESLSDEIKKMIISLPLLPDIESAVISAYEQLKGTQERILVAVRSSATAEDLPDASFAGQQESYLDVDDLQGVLDKIKECWASLWTARAIHYRAQKGYLSENIRMAVIVQEMIPAQISGVMFTANPVNNSRSQMLIEATTGLGEALVSGQVIGEKYIVAKKGYQQLSVTGADPERGPLFTEMQIKQLAHYGFKIEQFYGTYQDIEWAYVTGEFYFLQARPITTLADEHPPEVNWDKLNYVQKELMTTITERFPEPIYPLDGAVTKVFFSAQFESMADLGYSVPEMDWTRIEKGIFPEFFTPPQIRQGWQRVFAFLKLPHTLNSNPAAAWRYNAQNLSKQIAFVNNKKLNNFPYETVFEYLEDALKNIYAFSRVRYKYFAENRLPNALLVWLLRRLFGKEAKEIHENLSAGIECVTLEIDQQLGRLTQLALQNPEVRQLILKDDVQVMAEKVAKVRGGEEFLTAYHEFIELYGDRETSIGLGGLAVPTWREAPEVVWGILKGMLSGDRDQTESREQALQQRRKAAEQKLKERLSQGIWSVLPIKRLVFKFVEHSRSFAAFREDSHFDLAKALAVLRVLYLELGKRLVNQHLLDDPMDIMYLSYFELKDLVYELFHFRSVKEKSLKFKIAENKAFYQRRLARWKAKGTKYKVTANDLIGVAACSGLVTGPVRIILDPREFHRLRAGDIIVAPYTNPTWTPLFATAAGIVADTGGAASHTAIIAREYGIPAVMGVPGASRILRDGEIITVDGSQGVIIRTEKPVKQKAK